MACKKNEKFVLYEINQLINSDFDKKPQKSCILILTSFTKLLLVGSPTILAACA